jgi:uncharacterized RDD family membrane protein YckC
VIETPSYAVPAPGRRAVARLVDILTVLTWVWAMSVAQILFHLPHWSNDIAPSPWGEAFLFGITVAILYTLYEVSFVSRAGATPGKDLMRLKVLDVHTGEPPSVRQAVRRSLPLSMVWLIPPAWVALPLTAALGATGLADRRNGRAVHDLLGSTLVVQQLELEVEPGDTIEDAEAERRNHFMPRFVDPIQLLPSQLFRHPGAPRPGGPGLADDAGPGGGDTERQRRRNRWL